MNSAPPSQTLLLLAVYGATHQEESRMVQKAKLRRKSSQVRTKESFSLGTRVPLRISNYVIHPSAMKLVKSYVNRARLTGLVKNPYDSAVGMRALVAAGMAKASENKTKFVKPKHIEMGWSEKLSVGGGNCPPHLCIARSILMRTEELRESLPHFKEMLDEI
jgi:hypothetical protein